MACGGWEAAGGGATMSRRPLRETEGRMGAARRAGGSPTSSSPLALDLPPPALDPPPGEPPGERGREGAAAQAGAAERVGLAGEGGAGRKGAPLAFTIREGGREDREIR